MKKVIYTIALECKEFTKNNIAFFKQLQAGKWAFFVTGANKQYKTLLLSLCVSAKNKYPIIAEKLKEHVYQYDNNTVIHQSAIDELIDYIITIEQTSLGDRKFFVSHASADASIVNAFVKEILMLGCGFSSSDIFCTLDHTAIRTGDDFRNEIIKNMKGCDYIMCMISDNYRNSEVCQNELGAAWALENKRILPFKFPNIKFTEIGFLNVIKQTADITDDSKLDELYMELCECYSLQQDWINFNQRKADFIKVVKHNL
ncbi:MAG: toll/interleukin-1 receptor domain-containing protein [Muribaculaceae bacterium]|nr:toll/interleukin-1 receptor domain-containing protein [Muribaculaceae bacterium]